MKNYAVLIISTLTLLLGAALAQTPISYTQSSDAANYETVHVLEAGDVPGHIFRIHKLVWDQAKNDNPPIFNGVKVEKMTQTSFSDYTNSTGSFHGFEQYHLENGETLYGRFRGTTQTVLDEDRNVVKSAVLAVHEITGGTGSFEGIEGLLRSSLSGEPGPDATFVWSEVEVEGSYWMPGEVMGGQ